MGERKERRWISPLPASAQRLDGVSHRYKIAGRSAIGGRRELAAVPPIAGPGMVSDAMRQRMVERLRVGGIADDAVLEAMRIVPRHHFVEPALASRAYEDTALPIGHSQTVSQPYTVATMLALMRNGRSLARVLEVGTGCGYQACVLGWLAGLVVTIERVRPLHELARQNLRVFRQSHVRLHYGDGMLGLASEAPYDGIVVAAAGTSIPGQLLEQLSLGGRLVAPVSTNEGQRLVVIERTGGSSWQQSQGDGVNFVPLLPGTR